MAGDIGDEGWAVSSGCRPWCAPGLVENMLFAGVWRLLGAEDVPSAALPPCCGWDDPQSSPFYDAACGTTRQHFRKEAGGSYRGQANASHFAEVGGHACKCSPPPLRYTWDGPVSCTLAEWDAGVFCALLGAKQTITLVGDSTMEQTASTLMNMIATGGGGCQSRVVFAPGDTLLGRPMGRMNRGTHWLEIVRQTNPDFVVLNAGAHVDSEDNYDEIVDSVLNASSSLPVDLALRYAPKVPDRPLHILWKTQQPGGCLRKKKDRDALKTQCYESNEHETESYNYATFLQRDERTLAKINKAARQASHLKQGDPTLVSALDMRMLYWREDAHVSSFSDKQVDCLHYCLRTQVLSSTFPRMLQHDLATRRRHTSL